MHGAPRVQQIEMPADAMLRVTVQRRALLMPAAMGSHPRRSMPSYSHRSAKGSAGRSLCPFLGFGKGVRSMPDIGQLQTSCTYTYTRTTR